MKWRYVLGAAAVWGVALFLPFVGLGVFALMLWIAVAYLLFLGTWESFVRLVPALHRRYVHAEVGASWLRMAGGAPPPPNAPSPDLAAMRFVGNEMVLAGGWARLEDGNLRMRASLEDVLEQGAWKLWGHDGEWVATPQALWLVCVPFATAVRVAWTSIDGFDLLPPRRAFARDVRLATADGRAVTVAVKPAAAVHLEAIAFVHRGRAIGTRQ